MGLLLLAFFCALLVFMDLLVLFVTGNGATNIQSAAFLSIHHDDSLLSQLAYRALVFRVLVVANAAF